MTELTEKPKRKRRWLRFNLRSFLILVSILSAWVGWYVYRAETQRATVQWVQEHGGIVVYGFEADQDLQVPNNQPLSQKWLHEMFGVDYFGCVVGIFLTSSQVSDLTPLAGRTHLKELELDLRNSQVQDLAPLTGLTNLDYLLLVTDKVNDLTPLAGLTNLEELWLDTSLASDLTPLACLTNLEYLYLWETQVSNEEIAKLQEALPNCRIVLPE